MTDQNWKPLLHELSRELLRDADICFRLDREGTLKKAKRDYWLGFQPASEDDVTNLEKSLGADLPKSYRNFLLTTNGWSSISYSIDRLLHSSNVDWYHVTDSENIAPWIEEREYGPYKVTDADYFVYGNKQDPGNLRPEYLLKCLKVSDTNDGATILLNPIIRDKNGEWEAWLFDVKLPGARRYRSFYELMQAQLETAREYQPQVDIQSLPRPNGGNPPDEPGK